MYPQTICHVKEIDLLWLRNTRTRDQTRLICLDSYLKGGPEIKSILCTIDASFLLITDDTSCNGIIKQLHSNGCEVILLILSGSITDKLLDCVTPDVHKIFISCADQIKHLDVKYRSKVDIVCDSSSVLVQRIKDCWSSIEYRNTYEHEQESMRNLSKETAIFIWFHILRNVIRHLEKSAEAKNDMIEYFQACYHGNNNQLDRVTEFIRTYDSKHVFWWYTRENFISDIINKSLRSQNFEALYALRYYLVDLFQSLEEELRPIEELIVYRGVLMNRDMFENMKSAVATGDLVSMRGFLSTSRYRTIAETFGMNDANDMSKVCFV